MYANLLKMLRNNDYITGNLLHYSYHQTYYKLIGIDVSRQTTMTIAQHINFTGKLEEENGTTMIFTDGKLQRNYFMLSISRGVARI